MTVTGHVRDRQWIGPDGETHTSWYWVLELGHVAGQRRRDTRGGYRTRKAAEAALRKALNAREGGTYAKPNRVSFADFVSERWLPMIEAKRRPTTHDLYSRMMRLHVLPALGSLALQDVRPIDVETLYLALAKPSDDGKRKALGARSLHNVATVVHGALQHALELELAPRNPAARISPPAYEADDEGEPAHWTAAEVASFLDHVDAMTLTERTVSEKRTRKSGAFTYTRTFAPDPMQRALWYVLAMTGMRRGEVCGLRWSDLDAGAGLLTIRRSRVVVGGKTVESAPKTRRGRRTLALDPATLATLEAWRRAQLRERLRYGQAWEDEDGHVFTHAVYFTKVPRHGVPLAPRWITGAFQTLVRSSELPPLHLHGLRHSWATAALEAGEHLRSVADHLGHADTAVTDRTYTHTVRRVQDASALRVADLIASKRGGEN
jgi:integrase